MKTLIWLHKNGLSLEYCHHRHQKNMDENHYHYQNFNKFERSNFINPEERYPVTAATSKLMTTGVDAQTCKLIVLDSNIQSVTEFKQIIGRCTRINETFDKTYFTIIDFRNATKLFADKDFDGDPIK